MGRLESDYGSYVVYVISVNQMQPALCRVLIG
jgi:hypothetical protein